MRVLKLTEEQYRAFIGGCEEMEKYFQFLPANERDMFEAILKQHREGSTHAELSRVDLESNLSTQEYSTSRK